MLEKLVDLDQWLLQLINKSFLSQYPDFWLFVTDVIHWIPVYLLLFLLLFIFLKGRTAIVASVHLVITTAITLGLTNFVKNQVKRLRPNNDLDLLNQINILQMPENYSFWSGHSAVSIAVVVFFILVIYSSKKSRWWFLFFIWPLLFGISRLFIGVHYPLDVITGYIAGTFIGYGFYKIYNYTITSRGLT